MRKTALAVTLAAAVIVIGIGVNGYYAAHNWIS